MYLYNKIINVVYRVILALVFFVFSFLTMAIIFNNKSYFGKINIVVSIVGIVIICCTMLLIYMGISKYTKNLTKKKEISFLFTFFSFFVLIQLICGYYLKVTPSWDYGVIYDNAVSFAKTGSFTDLSYFYTFPNNIGLLLILLVAFKICSVINVNNFYMVGVAINIIAICISIFILYKIVKKKFNITMALFTLILSSFVLAFFTYVPIFYTDTISMPFILILLYALECVETENLSISKKILYYFIVGLLCFIGIKIKLTVVIMFIAIFLYKILAKKKNFWLTISILSMILLNTIFQRVVMSQIEKRTSAAQIPFTHWIMMGMNSTYMGCYNEEDYALTESVATEDEIKELNISEIKKRLNDFGIVGYSKFLIDKANITWGDGTYFAPEKLRRGVVNYNVLHDYVLAGSKHFDLYFTFCQIVHFTIMGFISLSSFILLFRKEHSWIFTTLLSLFGILLFLLMWETRSRYIVNYIPVMIMSTLIAFQFLFDKALKIISKHAIK